MPSTSTPATTTDVPMWRKALYWIQALEDVADLDPNQVAIDRLNRRMNALNDAVRNLESQLEDRKTGQR